jgi:hypothetical protein
MDIVVWLRSLGLGSMRRIPQERDRRYRPAEPHGGRLEGAWRHAQDAKAALL